MRSGAAAFYPTSYNRKLGHTTIDKSESAREERWAPIPEWPGYDVSDHGRVRSWRARGPADGRQLTEPRLLTLQTVVNGYIGVHLRAPRARTQTATVHRLVLMAFIGPPADGQECRHLNGIRSDNRLSNLAWGTKSQNEKDKVAHGTSTARGKRNRGAGHPQAKLALKQCMEIALSALPTSALMVKYGVGKSTIGHIKTRKHWSTKDAGVPIVGRPKRLYAKRLPVLKAVVVVT